MFVISFLLTGFISAVVVACYVMLFSFTLWMVIDAGKQDRFWWIAIMIGVPFVGVIVYYLTEKKHEYAKAPSHHIHDSQTEAQHETSHEHHEHHRKGDAEPGIILASESHENKKEIKKGEKEEVPQETKVTEIA